MGHLNMSVDGSKACSASDTPEPSARFEASSASSFELRQPHTGTAVPLADQDVPQDDLTRLASEAGIDAPESDRRDA